MRDYMKAYQLKDLRCYSGWTEEAYQPAPAAEDDEEAAQRVKLDDESIVYLGDDFVVNRDVFDDSPVIFNKVSAEWKAFCEKQLGFAPPDRDGG